MNKDKGINVRNLLFQTLLGLKRQATIYYYFFCTYTMFPLGGYAVCNS